PLSDRNLERLAARALLGLGRTGSSASNGSGDYVIAFSTAPEVRRRLDARGGMGRTRQVTEVTNDDMSQLFEAAVEATEEAIYNSLFMATTVTSNGRTVHAIPLDELRKVLEKYRVNDR